MQRIMLPDEDAEIDPVPGAGGGHHPAHVQRARHPVGGRTGSPTYPSCAPFNEHFGDIRWEDADRVDNGSSSSRP